MKWHKGPPPEIGWWPASRAKDKECLRWWDGKCWSFPAYWYQSASFAGRIAKVKSEMDENIQWTDRWWL